MITLARASLTTVLGFVAAVYVPHLAEEALTGMYDDPIIVFALAPLLVLGTRHAAYLTFQIMFASALVATYVWSRGERGALLLLSILGISLLAEGHHVVRALASLQTNSGLVTSLPMPILGAFVLQRVVQEWRAPSLSPIHS